MDAKSYASEYRSPAYRKMALYFLSLAAGVAALAAYIVYAKATVVVLAEREPISAEFTVDVSRAPGEGEVLGDVVEETATASQTFPVASLLSADAPAEGKVTITSSVGRSQTLVATTRLLTDDGRLYRIKNKVVVPARGSVEADAFADAPGAAGELAEGAMTIPGLGDELRPLFKVAVSQPFIGGQREVKLVTQKDVDAAGDALMEKLRAELALKVAEKVDGGAASTTIEKAKQATDVAVGVEADAFTVTVTAVARTVKYDDTILETLVEAKLRERVPEGRVFLYASDEGYSVKVEKADAAERRARIAVAAAGEVAVSDSVPAFAKTKLTGISVDAARKYLEGIDGVSSASVNVRPFWVGRMPSRARNIHFEVR